MEVLPERIILNCHEVRLVKNVKDVKYREILEKIFKNSTVKNDCRNGLNIFEITLIMPFTNAKFECIFSKINWVKPARKSHLTRTQVHNCLSVGEERPPVEKFNSDAITDLWF